jgi:DNA repair protein SbcC/Rad50
MITSVIGLGKRLTNCGLLIDVLRYTIYDCAVIPLHLKLSGFLSYRDPVEVDFTGFDLACISGSNGAGKSSLLDAITWVLFGQARKRDEAIVNLQSKVAEVVFTFAYENTFYRVQRSLPRGKGTSLEFQIAEGGNLQSSIKDQELTWRPLTERTLRDTQARIERILRLDYDTFVNVSFFLQGRADQFAQQPPTRRKDILGNILGLEAWEIYRERAAEHRKVVERELDSLDGRVAEIDSELAEEEPRKAHLAELENQLTGLAASRRVQETALANIKQVQAALDKQRELVRKLGEVLKRSQESLAGYQARLVAKEAERSSHAELVRRAAEVEAAYTSLEKARLDLEKWEQVAGRFREHDQRRQPLLREIESERARLEQERIGLEKQSSEIGNQVGDVVALQDTLADAKKVLDRAETDINERTELEKQIQSAREKQAELRAENLGLKTEMDELDSRIKKLSAAAGALCPLCGQSLSPEHRQATLEQLDADGRRRGDRWRSNKSEMEELAVQITNTQFRISNYSTIDKDRLTASKTVAQIDERLESLQNRSAEWKKIGAKRLVEVTRVLEKEKFAVEARKKLAKVDQELAELGYEIGAHDAARHREVQLRHAEAEYRALESARAALKPLDDEIANLESAIHSQQSAISDQQKEFADVSSALSASESQAPDLDLAERSLFSLQERENQLHQEVGAARQKVNVLDDQRKRKKKMETERGELGIQIGRFKALERAFGKDGVPALLIEQALPQIEMKANDILGRLSDDTMRLHFETQAKYKDEKRKDLRETLEIQVSDGAGQRDYEMYSGGEAFRVNFAIRLALSEVLAQRKGARLQMLVIDEGFGSQDALGRQRLIQAINAVKADFAKILVITHLEELKDAFPTRIEVEKTETGSTVVVI